MKIRAAKGQTLDEIAYQTGHSTDEVVKLNPYLTHKFKLDANDEVLLPTNKNGHKEKKLVRLFN